MANELDTPAVASPDETPFFSLMRKNWKGERGDPDTVSEYLDGAHKRDLEAAARPPVVNVTVEGLPGHYSADTATGEVAYVPEGAPGPCA